MKAKAAEQAWRAQNFGGCGCSLGLSVCNCTSACELPEPVRFDRDGRELWKLALCLFGAVAVVFAIGLAAAFL